MRSPILLALLVVSAISASCYTPLEDAVCYQDGTVTSLEETTACCDPTGNDQSDRDCAEFYREYPPYAHLAEMAFCSDTGQCAIDCTEGTNCECTQSFGCGDCTGENGEPKGCGCTVAGSTVCRDHGQQTDGRCTICRECWSHSDCASGPHAQFGSRCLNINTTCGCQDDDDCPDGSTCQENQRCAAQ